MLLHTSSTLMNRSRPWFSMKWRQVVGDSSVRFQSALSVNFRVASTRFWFAFWRTMCSSCYKPERESPLSLKQASFMLKPVMSNQKWEESYLNYEQLCSQLGGLFGGQLQRTNMVMKKIWRAEKTCKSDTTCTLAANMEMIATAILCMFWSSWLQSHCITSLAASNLVNKNVWKLPTQAFDWGR